MKRAPRGPNSLALVAAAALVVVLLAAAAPPAAAAVVALPLSLQAVLDGVKRHITNWPEFSAANNLTGWGADPAVPPCLYTGVTCDADGALQSLALQCPRCSVRAEGTLAPEIAKSASLATINVQYNRLAGPLPAAYGEPGAASSLLHLIVSYNQLSGSIPDEWSNPEALPRMTLLGIAANRLSGTLPEDLLLPSLLVLRANGNNFTGPLPTTWGTNGSMPQLRVASLQNNSLTGLLPAEWATEGVMTHLEEMYLQDNQLTGGLPEEWGAWEEEGMSALRVLNVSNNPLGGTLPHQWSQQQAFPALTTLVLSNTSLQGTLPASWDCQDPTRCGLPQLQSLWLDGNNFSGPVPPSWSSLSTLQAVFVRPGNELLLCDARGMDCPDAVEIGVCAASVDCQSPVDLANCSSAQYPELVPPGAEPAAAAAGPAPADSTAEPSSAVAAGGGGGSSVGAIVGGVVGGLAAMAAAVAALLLNRRWRRRKKRKRELPFYSGEPAGEHSGHGMLASPFAAMAAELGPPAANRMPGEQPLPQRSSTSAGSFFTMMMGGDPVSVAAAAEAADRELDAEVKRHLDIELAALEGTPSQSTAQRGSSLRESPTTAGTGSQSRRLTPPSKSGSADSQALQWEDSVPLSDWLITPSEIQIAKRPDGSDWELGSGGFGKARLAAAERVYKALRHSAQPVAVKVLAAVAEATRYQSQEDFKREIAILRACRDPNIVAFLGASLQIDRTMLVTEYCDGGNLTRNLMAGRIALDVARGLTYLHSRRIIHFDLKSPNILLARDGTAKISDVGMAKIMAREYSGVTGNVGTLAWAAPEMLLGARCTEKADIYSYGVVLWEICTCMTPIRGQLRDVGVPQECPAEVRELILDCLATNPRKRPSAVEIVDRLRAMPDPRPPQAAAAAAAGARARLQQLQQQPRRPQQQAAGLARQLSGTVAAQLAATSPASTYTSIRTSAPPAVAAPGPATGQSAGQQQPSSQRSSEESNLSMLDAEGEMAQALAAAYASPAPGTSLEAAQAALRRATTSRALSMELPRRSASILLASLPKQHPPALLSGQQQQQQGQEPPRMKRVSSSPAVSSFPLEEVPLAPSPTGTGSPGAAAKAMRPLGPRPPRPGPRHMQRRRSLDDPSILQLSAQQQATIRQAAGMPSHQQLSVPGLSSAAAAAGSPLVQQLARLQQRLRQPVGRQVASRLQSLQQPEELARVTEVEEEGEQPSLPQQPEQPHRAGQLQGEELAEEQQEELRVLAGQQHSQQQALTEKQHREQRFLHGQHLADRQRLGQQQQAEREQEAERQQQSSGGSPERGAPQPGGAEEAPEQQELQQATVPAAAAAAATVPQSPFALVSAFLHSSAETVGSPKYVSPFAQQAGFAEVDEGAGSSEQPSPQQLQPPACPWQQAAPEQASPASQGTQLPGTPPQATRRSSPPELRSPFDNA
ncbi:hypothetical protein CHLNCDRAFT_136066 [Chlorella variabilis]|uniref:Protein kinase domain-containing protein n=1 Tax=Chlorella variabilis TaxID=554065 RepID=E1ZJN9_CHLVA|nr:hypothetical protein CHLNCDRAFT_136066 [Chlorella variabilis]EFN54023.1 hypothetical protein CHLNCDRAFT_136066 [Chlorella variabilis]|eukprot:XP_005846125.1 hypothetical protein CHLNCDRAFT_136066 [Chlorella variabilis]